VVTLRNVLVLNASDVALLCRIEGRDRWIFRDQLREGTTLRAKGDQGTLVVPRDYAVEWGLSPYDED
jgi:hypothetical protein